MDQTVSIVHVKLTFDYSFSTRAVTKQDFSIRILSNDRLDMFTPHVRSSPRYESHSPRCIDESHNDL